MKKKWILPLAVIAVIVAAYCTIDYFTGNRIAVKEVFPSAQQELQLKFSWKTLVYGIKFYIWDLSDGDLGNITVRGYRGTIDVLNDALKTSWRSAATILPGLGAGVALGTGFGILSFFVPAAVKRISVSVSRLLVSVPDLLLIILLQIGTIQFNKAIGEVMIRIGETADNQVFLLPLLSMAVPIAVFMYIYTVNACDEVLHEEYVRTAKSKGLPNRVIFFKHVLRPAADSILSIIPKVAAMAASSLVIIERMFNIKGLTWFFGGKFQTVQPVLMAELLTTILIILAIFMTGIYLLTSLLRLWVNPALRK